jgi:hypothetical protein
VHGQKRLSVRDELSSYSSDLVDQTQSLIGREKELDRLIELLSRFSRKNPVLVGEPGVGKRTIVGGLSRRIADGNIPQSLAEKAILVLDLPPLRVLEKEGSWYERLDRALVAAAEDGKIFFLNRMHDRLGEISPVAPIHVMELMQRSIIAGKIQCIGTSTPANFAKLLADRHWLAEYFEPIEVTTPSEETAIKVLQGIKGAYEKFHNVSYTDDAIGYAVLRAKSTSKTRVCRVQPSMSSTRRARPPNCSAVPCQRGSSKFKNAFVSSPTGWKFPSRITNLRKLGLIHGKNARNVTIWDSCARNSNSTTIPPSTLIGNRSRDPSAS